MINYYEELKLNRNNPVELLRDDLLSMERVWIQRQVDFPEKANGMLSLISSAKEAFRTEESKAAYDKMLDNDGQEGKNDDSDKRETFYNLFKKANSFYMSGDYDLAIVGIQDALRYADPQWTNEFFYGFASTVYSRMGKYDVALDYANKAIYINPDNPTSYVAKSNVIAEQIEHNTSVSDYSENEERIRNRRELLQKAIDIAEKENNISEKADALGVYAYSLCFEINPDFDLAEKLGLEAKMLGETLGNAQKAIDGVARKKQHIEKQKRYEEKYEQNCAEMKDIERRILYIREKGYRPGLLAYVIIWGGCIAVLLFFLMATKGQLMNEHPGIWLLAVFGLPVGIGVIYKQIKKSAYDDEIQKLENQRREIENKMECGL